jgi:hypothetical protein
MNKVSILPIVISIIQFSGLLHLLYTYKFSDSQIPRAFIELHIWSLLSVIVLIFSYFFYFNPKEKINLWLIPIGISFATIVTLIICYIVMAINKYK